MFRAHVLIVRRAKFVLYSLWYHHIETSEWCNYFSVPGVFPGGKGGRCVRLTILPTSCAVVMKSGNFNFLEPSGLLQVCNGTALPLPLPT